MPAPAGNTNAKRAWDVARDTLLLFCVAEKLTGGETAREINKQFRTNFTRNAVIGRAFRLGVRFQSRCAGPRSSKPEARAEARERHLEKDAAAAKKRREAAPAPIHQRVLPMPQFNRDGLRDMRCAEVAPQNVDLLDLAPNGCRWPQGDSPFVFCNHPQVDGSSYCLDHHALSIGFGTSSEKRAHRVSGLD